LNVHRYSKADLCRVAALHEYGGYYFDVGIRTVEPVRLAAGVEFATVLAYDGRGIDSSDNATNNNTNSFSRSFIAAAPRHPILEEALRNMLLWYEEGPNASRGESIVGLYKLNPVDP
jgi:mannosyltransferase OCH1-like enzyme